MPTIPEIKPEQSIELLKELHILTRDGKLNQDSRRKLKQVYHLYHFIEPLLGELLAEGALLLRGFALARAGELIAAIALITTDAPFRHMQTPGGRQMSVAMSNCGRAGEKPKQSGSQQTRWRTPNWRWK